MCSGFELSGSTYCSAKLVEQKEEIEALRMAYKILSGEAVQA